jgi:synaptosomal-associated protein 29
MSNRNPFDDDDREYKFGNRGVEASDPEADLKQLHERMGRVENDSLESSRRALRCLNETHEVGVNTARELVRQGEQLNSLDERLDNVNSTLTATQKNLNQIKSIFGGIANKFSSWSSKSQAKSRGASTISGAGSMTPSNSFVDTAPVAKTNAILFPVISGSERERELNQNLDEMSVGLSRLTSLAKDMQFELDRQNPLIDKLGNKIDNTNTTITHQNVQIKKLLK